MPYNLYHMKRVLVALLFLLVIVAAAAWWWEGRSGPPTVTINQPGAVIGRTGTLDLFIDAPGGRSDQWAERIVQLRVFRRADA